MNLFELRDSRRLTGPNVIWGKAGPVVDLALADADADAVEQAWKSKLMPLLDGLGWGAETTASRRFPGGLSLAFSAPMDALYTACEINEWALPDQQLTENEPDREVALTAAIARFNAALRKEGNPPLVRIQHSANRAGSLFLTCDDVVSVGAGRWSESWQVKELPEAGSIDMAAHERIPIAMITGTNGKTTTVRLLKAMVDAQGKVPGLSSTDWLMVGNEVIDHGDWSGPGGARDILRNPNVDVALLETARGGMLRRGLALAAGEADVVLINNIAADHLGEWGVQDLDMLADTKFVIRHAGRHIVLNADDEKSVERVHLIQQPLTWFSLNHHSDLIQNHIANGGQAATLDGGFLTWTASHETTKLIPVSEIPITFGGAAQHNVANALAAICVAKELGLRDESILSGLQSFQSNLKDNPGRLNRFQVRDFTVLVDFAHNAHGLSALMQMTAAMPANRRLVTLGHAGDRNDDALVELAQAAAAGGVDRVIIKEQPNELRGRQPGEIPAILEGALIEAGFPAEQIAHAANEMEATQSALDWAESGDLLLLLTLDSRKEVLGLLQKA